MWNSINETGNRYGKLVVIRQVGRNKKGKGEALWECLCDCPEFEPIDFDNMPDIEFLPF